MMMRAAPRRPGKAGHSRRQGGEQSETGRQHQYGERQQPGEYLRLDEKRLADPEQAEQEITEAEPPAGAGGAQKLAAARRPYGFRTIDEPDEHRKREEQHRGSKERRHGGR